MKETRKIMQVVTLLYLVLVGIGLYIAAKVLPGETLLNAILPLALILIVLCPCGRKRVRGTEMAEQKEVRGYKGGIPHERQREKNAGI